MKTITIEDLENAAGALARSSKGKRALRDLLALLDNGGVCLDLENQANVRTLLEGAWGEFAGTSREVMAFHLAKKGAAS